jgi:hypothetical protein
MPASQQQIEQELAMGAITPEQAQQAMLALQAEAPQLTAAAPPPPPAPVAPGNFARPMMAPANPNNIDYTSPEVVPYGQATVQPTGISRAPVTPPTIAEDQAKPKVDEPPKAPKPENAIGMQGAAGAGAGAAGEPGAVPSAAMPQIGIAPTGRRGLTGPESAYNAALGQEAAQAVAQKDEAVGKLDTFNKTFADETAAAADQSKLALEHFQQQQKANDERRTKFADEMKANESRINDELAKVQAAGIDPNKYFMDQSTGSKILGAIAVGLGAFGAGPLGPNGSRGQNVALQIMNDAITRDIDAQKSNMQKNLEVMGKRIGFNAQSFEHQDSLLKAEADSTTTAYSVAQNEVAKRMAMFKDNKDAQASGVQMTEALKDQKAQKLDGILKERLALSERASQAVGGGVMVKLPNGQVVPLATYKELEKSGLVAPTSPDVEKTQAETVKTVAEAQKAGMEAVNGKPISPRLNARLADLDSEERAAKDLNDIMSGGRQFSARETARKADAAAAILRNNPVYKPVVPEHPTAIWQIGMGGHQSAVATVLQDVKNRKKSIESRAQGGSGETEENANPGGGEKD